MRVIHGLESVQFTGVVLTIGNFDGVHRGHQASLAAGRRRADTTGARLVVMTFDPHPLAILTPHHAPPLLTHLDQKLDRLEHCGADAVVVAGSNPEFLELSPGEFIRQIIVPRFKPTAVVEAPSFAFGRNRRGDVNTLLAGACEHGFDVEVVEPVRVRLGGHPDTVISSSLIRQLLASGTVDQAAMCLGRPYSVTGRVIRNARRGQSLGFPTANVHVDAQLIPGQGVYAGRAEIDRRHLAAAISIGHNPTFDGRQVILEAHLLDFAADLYDRLIRLDFLQWIREQRKFDSPQTLRRQIERDVARTREVYAASSPGANGPLSPDRDDP